MGRTGDGCGRWRWKRKGWANKARIVTRIVIKSLVNHKSKLPVSIVTLNDK